MGGFPGSDKLADAIRGIELDQADLDNIAAKIRLDWGAESDQEQELRDFGAALANVNRDPVDVITSCGHRILLLALVSTGALKASEVANGATPIGLTTS